MLSRPFLGLETLGHQVSRPRPGQNELESQDHGLKITTLAASILDIGDRALA